MISDPPCIAVAMNTALSVPFRPSHCAGILCALHQSKGQDCALRMFCKYRSLVLQYRLSRQQFPVTPLWSRLSSLRWAFRTRYGPHTDCK